MPLVDFISYVLPLIVLAVGLLTFGLSVAFRKWRASQVRTQASFDARGFLPRRHV